MNLQNFFCGKLESFIFTSSKYFDINVHYILWINIKTLNKHIFNQRYEASIFNGKIVLDYYHTGLLHFFSWLFIAPHKNDVNNS